MIDMRPINSGFDYQLRQEFDEAVHLRAAGDG